MPVVPVPVLVERDRTLRVKIIDACGLTCTFCHNEGTPVVADDRRRRLGQTTMNRSSGRVSIYVPGNGVSFLPAPMPVDDTFGHAIEALRASLGLTELHLTGGEPTLHPSVARITAVATDAGFRVGMTSNGENGARALPECAAAGLDRVNFSIFGTTGVELAEVQHSRFRSSALAERKITALKRSIATCEAHGIAASANIVVLDHGHAPRVHRLLDEYSPRLSVRLLNSLDHGQSSISAIEHILAERGAVAEEQRITAGVAGARTTYRQPNGRSITFKQIRSARLPETCAGCAFNNGNDCREGFYGVRLYYDQDGRYQVGVCIQRMDLCLPLEEFLAGPLPAEIVAFARRSTGSSPPIRRIAFRRPSQEETRRAHRVRSQDPRHRSRDDRAADPRPPR